jgi:hypothetical protein
LYAWRTTSVWTIEFQGEMTDLDSCKDMIDKGKRVIISKTILRLKNELVSIHKFVFVYMFFCFIYQFSDVACKIWASQFKKPRQQTFDRLWILNLSPWGWLSWSSQQQVRQMS